jgi:type IV pilus assembly protein PilB
MDALVQPSPTSPQTDDEAMSEIEARLQQVVSKVRDAETIRAELAKVTARLEEVERDVATAPAPAPPQSVISRPAAPSNPDAPPPWAVPIARVDRTLRIGQLLLELDLISQHDLDQALELQQRTGRRVGEALADLGIVSTRTIAETVAQHLGVPFVDLQEHVPDVLLSSLIPEEMARRFCVLPVTQYNGQLVVAMESPNDVFALDDLRVATAQPILPVVADPDQLRAAIERAYRRSDIESSIDDATDTVEDTTDTVGANLTESDGPVVQLVSALLEQAVAERASDLHVEPNSDDVAIRMRVDGMLHDTFTVPLGTLRPLVSRLKVMGGMDIAQQRLPQDGRFSATVEGRKIDIRVATIPTAAGEAVVLRLLDASSAARTLDAIGLTPAEEAKLRDQAFAPQGAIFVTGPTGSGKSSTLYALASALNSRDKGIVSVEDPVEYRLEGVKQIHINRKAGMTFASALRVTLRADPDVIVVGEVRDAETARIAADASITGHMVLSTLHTTRAAAAPIRLIDMGVEPYLVSSALSCVVAQRLVRTPCEHCSELVVADRDVLRRLGATDDMLEGVSHLRERRGCQRCLSTGYRGRTAIVEIMVVSEEIAKEIATGASASTIERIAVAQGMDTLRIAGLRRVLRGELTLDDLARVVA